MTTLTIFEGDKAPEKRELEPGVYVIGKADRCTIRLSDPTVSSRHAILTIGSDGNFIEDMGSSNGTSVNEMFIDKRTKVAPSVPIKIGSYTLIVSDGKTQAQADKSVHSESPRSAPKPPPPPGARPSQGAAAERVTQGELSVAAWRSQAAEATLSPAEKRLMAQRREIKSQIQKTLVERLDLKRLTAARINSEELSRRAHDMIHTIVDEVRGKFPAGISPEEIAREVFDEALRLGPLEDLLADDSVTEIMVNGPDRIFVERNGRLVLSAKTFTDATSVMATIERIIAPLGRRIDESQPYVDARLADGSRVNAIIHPLSLVGPCLTIRKFSKRPLLVDDMIRYGTMTREMALFLEVCVIMRKNVVVSGGTGSGKTTLLNVLSNYLPAGERILTIEDAAELRLNQPHLVRLEARPPNIEGRGAITIRDLVRNALRMRPDRIIVGECRGGEALDMLQAMNTGHDGSLTTVHANTPRDVISRLETMVMMSGMELPSRAIREQIASAIDIIVHESRMSDGSRKIVKVSEISGLEGAQITMQDIFEFRQTGIGEGGKVLGYYTATGSVPTFFEELKRRGIKLDPAIFQPTVPGDEGGQAQ